MRVLQHCPPGRAPSPPSSCSLRQHPYPASFCLQGFIRVSNGRFVDASCREFLFHGEQRAAKGLDFILAEAGKYGIKVTLVLLNQWKKNNGVRTFEEW